jgi:acyl-CoA reductase-like NAD-dependent aldehyde dehydrogenase
MNACLASISTFAAFYITVHTQGAFTKPDMKVIREEIFAPVVAAIPFKELNDDLVKAGAVVAAC